MRFGPGLYGAAMLASIVPTCVRVVSPVVAVPVPHARRAGAPALLLIDVDGTLTLDGRRMTEAELDRALQNVADRHPSRGVVVAGAPEARYGGVLRALELANLAGVRSITLAAPDLHPLSAFPATPGEAGEVFARVAIGSDERVWLDQAPVRDDELAARVRDLGAARRPLTIIFAADRRTRHGRVGGVIDALRRAGVADFLITTLAPVMPSPAAGTPPWSAPAAPRPPASAVTAAGQVDVRDADPVVRPQINCDEEALRNLFPEAAQARGLTGMRVYLRVSVDAGGVITNAQALEDPGFGLGRAAVHAMMTSCHATPQRDHEGRPVATEVRFRLNFELE